MKSTPRFGQMQLRIMQVLWDRGQANAREITKALSKRDEVAHSTVQTLLRQLETKGAIGHVVEGRTFVFYARIGAQRVYRSAMRDFVNRLFQGSPSGLVSYLLKHESISREELRSIRQLIDEKEKRR